MLETGKQAADIVEEKGLRQISDTGEIEAIIDKVIADSPEQLAAYKAGKENLFGYFRRPGHEGHRRQSQSRSGQRFAEGQALTKFKSRVSR